MTCEVPSQVVGVLQLFSTDPDGKVLKIFTDSNMKAW